MRYLALIAALFCLLAPAMAEPVQSPRDVVSRAVVAQGGDTWLSPGTLLLVGEATFFAVDAITPKSVVDDYRMWREMGSDRDSAHGADGKVRIEAQNGNKRVFAVGYDGETTWTEKGIMPKTEADAYWASNFGFGIIRTALEKNLRLEGVPSRSIDGHPVDMVRIFDGGGQPTLFGFDKDSHFIRYMAFRSPRGWHERIYDDFVRLADKNWVQARRVTLFYDGVMANEVRWKSVAVGTPIDPAIFRFEAAALAE